MKFFPAQADSNHRVNRYYHKLEFAGIMIRNNLKVFLTVDVELWPDQPDWPHGPLRRDSFDFESAYDFYILGNTAKGNFGLPRQLEILGQNDLKATFFVEPLYSYIAGKDYLVDTVARIRKAGQEIGLHPHTEWLGELKADGLTGFCFKQFIHEYSRPEQASILHLARERLVDCGSSGIPVNRAGNFGANLDTLPALKEIGIRCDSSFNPVFAHSFPDIPRFSKPVKPFARSGVLEFPVSNFTDYTNHRRHAQICAVGFEELRGSLHAFWEAGCHSFTIVLHSFEFLNRSRGKKANRTGPIPISLYLRRFEDLCGFLARNRDKYVTSTFAEALSDDVRWDEHPWGDAEIRVPCWATAKRYIEQSSVKYIL